MPIIAGVPTTITVHNEDSVTHGFVSPMFSGLRVHVEGEGIAAFGAGIEGVPVAPDKTLVIKLTPDRQTKMTFRCDLHPNVQGELILLDVPVG